MLLGKRVVFLLFMLVLLVIYTVDSFDYNKILAKDITKNESLIKENNFEVFLNKLKEVKSEILVSLEEKQKEVIPSESSKTIVLAKKEEIKEKPSEVKDQSVQLKLKKEEVILKESKTPEAIVVSTLSKEKTEVIKDKTKTVKEVIKVEKAPIDSKVVQKEINTILEKKKIIFKRRSTTITKESILVVKQIAKILKKHENFKVEVAGHTDSRGKASLNKKLSQIRANSVRKALIYYGVNKDNLTAVGYGEELPIAKDDKNGLSIINRRVEFNIVGE